ncbi:hypothetical protein [Bacteroides nordii]|uniref:hypothetical protein n=1 Tax=Bacteroides nordii TaxID=291645 RepID=UPI003521932A
MVSNTDPYITGINDWSEDYYYAAGKLRRVTTLDGYLNLYERNGYRNYYAVKTTSVVLGNMRSEVKKLSDIPAIIHPV